jgi:3'-phosphoadenosine 5'-phosphosulfate sulfotransferase (PAPS reductase)/FAD synthetase
MQVEQWKKKDTVLVATSFKQLPSWIRWSNTNLMLHWVVPVGMKRRPAQKSVSFRIVMNLDSGIRKINVPNFGISSMEKKQIGEHFRIFPISNWTEMDIWQYILQENIPLPTLYYTHDREVFERDGIWYAALDAMPRKPTEEVVVKKVRCRTIGDISCTGLSLSTADSLEEIIEEIASSRITERGGRSDDKRSEAAMEDRKKAGYF